MNRIGPIAVKLKEFIEETHYYHTTLNTQDNDEKANLVIYCSARSDSCVWQTSQ